MARRCGSAPPACGRAAAPPRPVLRHRWRGRDGPPSVPRTGTAPSPCRPPSSGRLRGSPGLQPFDIIPDAGLDVAEAAIVAGAAQPAHIGLREALVAALQTVGKGDVLDGAFAERGDHRLGDRAEGLRAAGAAIEDAARALVPQPEVHVGDVADMDEIAALLAGSEAVKRPE